MLRGVWGFAGRQNFQESGVKNGISMCLHVCVCAHSGMGAGGSATEAASAETHRVLRDGGLLISITESSWELHGIMGPHG